MSPRRLRPRSRRSGLLALAAGVIVIVLGGVAIVYFVLFPTSSPKPFKLTATTPTTTSASAAKLASGAQLSGRWQIATGSLAGYRVREQLAFLPAQSDAVGRTSAINGSATLGARGAQVTVTGASFTVAVNTLHSDRSMRDERIHEIGLESDRYPTSAFRLTAPVALPSTASSGAVVHATAVGELTIHGTARTVSIPLEITLSATSMQAVGSLTFPWGEFNMSAPSIGGFVTVTDHATMEFDLHLARA